MQTLSLHEPWIRALAQTLLHSLWQGLLFAALAGLVQVRTAQQAPGIRYRSYTLLLLLFTLVNAGTFFLLLDTASASTYPSANVLPAGQAAPGAGGPAPGLAGAVTTFLERHSQGVVVLWLALVSLRSLQLGAGALQLRRLRRSARVPGDAVWQAYIDLAVKNMGLSRVVRLAVSGLARAPMVIGHLKPLILVPAALVTSLPPAELEAVLLHELAHIRRRDYLVNLLQSLVEIVYTFNPAVAWLSARIRDEREHCCDEAVLAQTGRRKSYISALLTCETFSQQGPGLALAFTGQEGQLMQRVQRMIRGRYPQQGLKQRAILALTLCLALLCGLISCRYTGQDKAKHDDRVATRRTPAPPPKTTGAGSPAQVLADDLAADGIIASGSSNLRFTLTANYLEVNGARQPAPVFRRYRDKYVHMEPKEGTRWQVTYTRETR